MMVRLRHVTPDGGFAVISRNENADLHERGPDGSPSANPFLRIAWMLSRSPAKDASQLSTGNTPMRKPLRTTLQARQNNLWDDDCDGNSKQLLRVADARRR